MNRIITINLGGYALSIEEDAYDLLRNYLRSLENHFSTTPNGHEIIADIEARLAEMFHEKLEKGKTFINVADVKEVLDAMGNPAELDEEGATQEESSYGRKKLYRDTENGIFGGVSAGLAVYFNTDVVWVRIIWLLLFFFGGIGFVPYILLWIIVPVARTKADRLAMEGKSPNLRNFQESFTQEAERVAGQWRERGERENWGGKFRALAHALGEVLRGFFRFIAGLFAIALILVGISILFGFTFGKIYTEASILPFTELPAMLGLEHWSLPLQISAMVVILIPLIALIVALSRYLLGTRPLPLAARRGMGISWLIAFVVMASLLVYTSMQFAAKESVVQKKVLAQNDTIQIRMQTLLDSKGLETIHFGEVSIDIEQSENDKLQLWMEKTSKGPNLEKALELAADIEDGYKYTNGQLLFHSKLTSKKASPFRTQTLRYILKVPTGTYVMLHSNTQDFLENIQNREDAWGRALAGQTLIMRKNGLECVDCSEKLSQEKASDVFDQVEIDGAFKVHFRQSEKHAFEMGSDEDKKRISHSIRNGKLVVSYNEKLDLKEQLDVLKDRPEIYISSPNLERIALIGANKAELDGLKGDLMEIVIEGASGFEAKNLDVSILDITIEGAGELNLSGLADKLLLKQEGAAELNAQDLFIREAILDISGGSKCQLSVSEKISGSASGASLIRYQGNPSVSLSTSGASRVEAED
jgi:phage shock protein PspC (stress-responsive transcriptional regulator)